MTSTVIYYCNTRLVGVNLDLFCWSSVLSLSRINLDLCLFTIPTVGPYKKLGKRRRPAAGHKKNYSVFQPPPSTLPSSSSQTNATGAPKLRKSLPLIPTNNPPHRCCSQHCPQKITNNFYYFSCSPHGPPFDATP